MKNLFKVFVLCLCLLTPVSFAFATNGGGAQDKSGSNHTAVQRGTDYVDANCDGICDNIGTCIGKRGKGYGAGRNQNKRKGFRKGLRNGKGQFNKTGMAKPNYVDANKDRVCDNFQNTSPSK